MSNITKKAIANALKELLLEKRLNKITVADIAEKCEINRQTFYYHFQDIYDLVEWICIEDTEQVLKSNRTYETWQEGFLAIFELAKKDKPFITNIYHSASYENLQQYLYRLVEPLLKGVITEVAKNYVVKDGEVEFVVNFYKYAFVGLLIDWVRNDMRGEPRAIIERVGMLIHGTTERYLNEYNRK